MATAAYNAAVKLAVGSTAFTGEGMTGATATRFYMTDQSLNLLDPGASITVYDGGVPVAAADYTVNHLAGQVTFDSAPGGAVTIDASAYDLFTVLEARQFTYSPSAQLLDTTVFGDTAIDRIKGLDDISITLSTLAKGFEDLDPGAGSVILTSVLTGGQTVVIDIAPDSAVDERLRAWCRLESLEQAADVTDLVELTITAQGHLPDGATTVYYIGDPGA